ncbi:MAG: SAV_2336 N-terminal domain-related protein [Cyanophyceae cyanobacterium]
MNVERLIAALAKDEQLDATNIAEVLWLTTRIQPRDKQEEKQPEETSLPDPDPSPLPDPGPPPPPPPPAPPRDSKVNGKDNEPPDPQIPIIPPPPRPTAKPLPQKALPLWVADPPLLDNPMDLIRALRPLLKQVPTGLGEQIDEAETVDRIVETRVWSPVLQPNLEPWFEIALIVDRSSSMNLWKRLADDLQQLLKHYGAFRDLRRWELETEAGAIVLRSHPDRPPHTARELVSPNGRRIVIILSDCVADYWWDDRMLAVLKLWAGAMPTAIWQVLPEWMWERTALGRGTYVALRNSLSGAVNSQLEAEAIGLDLFVEEEEVRGIPVPVFTSATEDVAAWSKVLSGDGQEVTAGFLLPQQGGSVPQAPSSEDEVNKRFRERPPGELTEAEREQWLGEELAKLSRDRIQQFRMLSSPQARQLITLLAAAPVITLPVMRLIRASMMSKMSPLPVAEVFLSGLLHRLPDQAGDIDPELVQYDFVRGVREALLKMLPPVDAIEIINAVSLYIAQRLGYASLQQFKSVLLSPEQNESEDGSLKSFASVTASILERLGGEYRELAREFRMGSWEETQFPGFPTLKILEFETAQLIPEEWPQWLPHEFVVEEVELEALQRFEFETAKIEPKPRSWFSFGREQEWLITKSSGFGWQRIERISDEIQLEMVAVLGESFLMGSPKDEAGHYRDEEPQHEVTVSDFFISKYPITQAQWQVVASLPEVNRALETDPSDFKSDNRPVENVSWYDAVEFCDRLSRHTNREYRLPTEAEWEYACRAGTTTSYYFGDTVTPELVNYSESKENETSSVGEYPANAFGLYDMHGNVWEWCLDHWHNSYQEKPEGLKQNGNKPWLTDDESALRTLRGGSWYNLPELCRSAIRRNNDPDARFYVVGFRVVCFGARTL